MADTSKTVVLKFRCMLESPGDVKKKKKYRYLAPTTGHAVLIAMKWDLALGILKVLLAGKLGN